MSDTRELLERARRQAPPPENVMDSLIRRRDRKRRNQRIAAGVVAIALFLVPVALFAALVLRGPDTRPAVPGSDPAWEGINGLPPEGATPSAPESGELVVELNHRVWVYADGRVISSAYLPTLEPYSGLVERHLTPEGVEFLRSNVLSTGLSEHDLDLAGESQCCLVIRVRDGDRFVRVSLGPSYAYPQGPNATPEQATALQSLEALLTSPASWPASVWTDQQIRAYVPTSYLFCSRFAEPSRVLALLPEPARDLLGAGYLKTDGNKHTPDCSRMTTEEARALVGILGAEFGHEGGPSLGFSIGEPDVAGNYDFIIAINPVLPHGTWAVLEGVG